MNNTETEAPDGFDDDILNVPECPLTEALYLRDLEKGAFFEIKPPENEDKTPDDYFNQDDILKNLNFECVEDGGSSDDENYNQTPFQRLRAKMTPLTNDRGVYKLIIVKGTGNPIPDKSYVTVHYNSYLEYLDEPMDSTKLRNCPKTFRLGAGEVLPGLDIAVASMRKGETSKFLIQPAYAFGPLGCPPRVPPDAQILYEVELLAIVDNGDVYEFESLSPEDRKCVPFKKVLAACKAENNAGNDFFRKNQIRAALKRYHKGMHLLEERSLSNDEEENDQKNLLIKLYLNISICYLKEQEAGKAEAFARRALLLDDSNPKALFRCGKALVMQNDYGRARHYLVQAQKKQPNNSEINDEIMNLDRREQVQKALEREFCKRMFQTKVQPDDKTGSSGKSS